MSRLTRIQDALRTIDPGAFQQLCDELLFAMGYRGVTQTGTVAGTNKVARGTPDTRFIAPDGRFVFAEYTTQQSRVFEKLRRDVGKCFDPSHSGVPTSSLAEIVLAHTSKLEAFEDLALRQEIEAHGAKATILGLSDLAFELRNHPALARDHLGIAVDTGQILSSRDFTRTYQRNQLATPIDTEFAFRTDEIAAALAALQSSAIVVVSGQAGVGKTRFALEVARKYAELEPEVALSCLYNHGVEMFEDLLTHYAGPGRHLVFVDDANRLGGFESILSVLRSLGPTTEVRVIATVRDYASKKVLRTAGAFGTIAEIKLEPMSKTEVRDLVKCTHDITDHLLLDRIATLARGNPRLAVMAARAARNKETFAQIHDASTLYESYFASVERDLGSLASPHLVAVAGVVALFRTIDRRNQPFMAALELGLGLSESVLWERIRELHELEIVDLHENEVAKASDQVLATYLMYLCFFKTRVLPFGSVLRSFFPRYRDRIMDSLHPIAEAFTGDDVISKVRADVSQARGDCLARGDDAGLMHLFDAFGAVEPTATLQFATARIGALPAAGEVPADFAKIEAQSFLSRPSIPTILVAFRSAEEDDLHGAIELLLRYVEKVPEHAGQVAHVLGEDFGIDERSYRRDYEREEAVVNALVRRTHGSPLFARLLLHVAGEYLQVEFVKTRAEGRDKLTMNRFVTPQTPALLRLRATIWRGVLPLARDLRYRREVLAILRDQRGVSLLGGEREIMGAEAELLQALLVDHLDATVYEECAAVRDYANALHRANASAAGALRARFCAHETLMVADVLSGFHVQRSERSWEQQQIAWRQGVHAHVANFDLDGYERLLACVPEILRAGEQPGSGFRIQVGVNEALLYAASATPDVFVELVRRCILGGNAVGVEPWGVAAQLTRILGASEGLELVTTGSYALKASWTFAVLFALSPSDAANSHVDLLCELYATVPTSELPFDIRQWAKFCGLHPGVVPRLLSVLLERATRERECVAAMRCLFMSFDAGEARALQAIAETDRHLAVEAYFTYLAWDAHGDFNGAALDFFIDLDRGVIDRLSDFVVRDGEESRGRERSYASLWKRADYATTVRQLILTTFDKLVAAAVRWLHLPRGLLLERVDEEFADPQLRARQDEVLCTMLRDDSGARPGLASALFEAICHFSVNRRLRLIRVQVDVDPQFESFRSLSLESSSMSWSGSRIPLLQERAEFWRLLRADLGGLELLEHRAFVEERLRRAEAEIVDARREEFLGD
jgi:hypothetical protein